MTRLSYCFLNPLRWLSGTPVVVGVVRRKPNTQTNVPDRACSVGLQYPSGIVYSLLAGYLRPLHGTPWSVAFTAEAGSLRIVPGATPRLLRFVITRQAANSCVGPTTHSSGKRQAVLSAAAGGRGMGVQSRPTS